MVNLSVGQFDRFINLHSEQSFSILSLLVFSRKASPGIMVKTAGSVSASVCDRILSSITQITKDVFAITVTERGAFEI